MKQIGCQMQAYRDDRGNNILHVAAIHGPAAWLDCIKTSGLADWRGMSTSFDSRWFMMILVGYCEMLWVPIFLWLQLVPIAWPVAFPSHFRPPGGHFDAVGRLWPSPQPPQLPLHSLPRWAAMAAGFGINPRDSKGWTPISIAAFHGHKKICQVNVEPEILGIAIDHHLPPLSYVGVENSVRTRDLTHAQNFELCCVS